MHIIADNTIPFLEGVIEPLGEVSYLTSGQFTKEAVHDADVLIVRSVDKCTREILAGSQVKLITTATIGFDHIDTAYCDEAGIIWKNAPGSNARSVAEYLIACFAAYSLQTGYDFKGKTIAIVGVGHVGSLVEKLCSALGMRVLRNDPPRAEQEGNDGFTSLDRIAEEADIITFHTPLTKEGLYPTFHLADQSFVNKLKKQPLLINTCRGAVFETNAILRGVESKQLGDLIIDCWEQEPIISLELLKNTAIATPHIAGFSADGKANATRMCLKEISHFFGIHIEHIDKVQPAAPSYPIIDLNSFSSHRIEHAILTSFNPSSIDKALREGPDEFEQFRTNYKHPREFSAYTVKNALPEEATLLNTLGFQLTN